MANAGEAQGTIGADDLRRWVGREETCHDVITAAPVRALAATLDHPTPCDSGAELPPLWHWGFLLPSTPTAELGDDGHPHRGGFLPPIALPRRMWAGSRLEFVRPLRVGDAVSRRSTVADVQAKAGRSGPLVFVKVRHEVSTAGALAIVEEHDIVYRERPAAGPKPGVSSTPPAAPREAVWRRRVEPSAVLLFRYSAITFNGHRIHFDRPYATHEEGYPGLVVHGPLIATLLLDGLRRERPAARVRGFSFRAMQPLFDSAAFFVCGGRPEGDTVALWAEAATGALATEATVRLG